MIIEVRDREFKVTFVNNYVRDLYNEMLIDVDDLTALPDEIEEIAKIEDRKERKAQVKDVTQRQRKLIRKISETRLDMLKELLSTNGLDYDEHWWRHSTDVDDINQFVFSCIQKDVSEGGASKKK